MPENGHESPQSPNEDNPFGMGVHNGGRRRPGWPNNDDKLTELDISKSAVLQNGGRLLGQHIGVEEDSERTNRVGFRDRIGCYTWTWFTMTMATGGVANVLHSSNGSRICCQGSSALMNFSSIPVRLAKNCWHPRLLVQFRAVPGELLFLDPAIQVEFRVISSFPHQPI